MCSWAALYSYNALAKDSYQAPMRLRNLLMLPRMSLMSTVHPLPMLQSTFQRVMNQLQWTIPPVMTLVWITSTVLRSITGFMPKASYRTYWAFWGGRWPGCHPMTPTSLDTLLYLCMGIVYYLFYLYTQHTKDKINTRSLSVSSSSTLNLPWWWHETGTL